MTSQNRKNAMNLLQIRFEVNINMAIFVLATLWGMFQRNFSVKLTLIWNQERKSI